VSAWLGILAIVIGTLLARSLLPVLGARVQLQPRVEAALRFAPGCALAAIVLPELLLVHGNLMLGPANLRLIAAAAAAVICHFTRSTLGTIVGGMAAFWALLALFGG
jgi:branched-subunit amino acid transport protein